MNINKITQIDLDKILKEYYKIAYNNRIDPLHLSVEAFKEYITSKCYDGYRFGIQGWMHTKLMIEVGIDGRLRFYIYTNGDKFKKYQETVLDKLSKWCEKINEID